MIENKAHQEHRQYRQTLRVLYQVKCQQEKDKYWRPCGITYMRNLQKAKLMETDEISGDEGLEG